MCRDILYDIRCITGRAELVPLRGTAPANRRAQEQQCVIDLTCRSHVSPNVYAVSTTSLVPILFFSEALFPLDAQHIGNSSPKRAILKTRRARLVYFGLEVSACAHHCAIDSVPVCCRPGPALKSGEFARNKKFFAAVIALVVRYRLVSGKRDGQRPPPGSAVGSLMYSIASRPGSKYDCDFLEFASIK